MIQVCYFATLREITGKKKENVDKTPATVLALMEELSRRHGNRYRDFCLRNDKDGVEISRTVNILVNGHHIHHLQGGATPLEDEDVVSVFPLIGGG